ncbi:acetate--CoA ligase family protein [Hyphomicrobium sp. CS1BSMeth3]|uniref:acetate--CoA ligase family protein n=1 Tax=Hyphomicrobium sp. CS1BSMeth3 TaxID=1892844 RepID=UPI000931CB76|nr:acetate--CoA ligase family protein [Hyphomicrobium sp. CS1BSMeth3]
MADIAKLLSPRNVAVIGAAPKGQGLRGRILEILTAHPYAGSIYPVSRSNGEVQGLKAYPTIGAVPGPVDLAVLIIPAEFVVDELRRCGEAGVGAIIVLSSGFAEEPGEAGAKKQAEIKAIAAEYGMAIMGPNSEGFANLPLALCPTFSPAVAPGNLSLLPKMPLGGRRVSVIAQSGGMGFGFYDRGRPKELGFNHIVTTGNEACLEVLDYADHLIDDPGTDVLLMLVEDIKTGSKFSTVAEKALRAGKPIILSKIGQSDAGARAAASHTAALAGSYASFSAMAHHYGIVEGRDLEHMVDLAQGFLAAGPDLPAGRRVGICTASGGGGGWIADACAAAGLEVPELDAATRREIDKIIPSYGTSQNPVDGTAQAIRSAGYAGLAGRVAPSPMVDGIIVVMSGRAGEHVAHEREALIKLRQETKKPIFMWSYTLPVSLTLETLAEAGYPLFTNMHNATGTMAAMADYRERRERFLAAPAVARVAAPVHEHASEMLSKSRGALTEYEARRVLAAYGIGHTTGQYLAKTVEQAAEAAAAIGGPVAMKVQSPDILHKTEAGGVALGITEARVREAFATIIERAQEYAPDAKIDGVLVQPMAEKGREVILGINTDPLFGPMLMVGLGGIHVEVLKDVALGPVPLSKPAALALIDQLKGRALLDAQRGAPAADVDALAELMVKLSRFAADHAEAIAEIDLNPVFVHPKGQGVTIADALIIQHGHG